MAMEIKLGAVWHAYKDQRFASFDEWGDASHSRLELTHSQYVVTKVTPKGAWLQQFWGQDKGLLGKKFFVRAAAVRKKACPTKVEALESLVARKTSQMRILSRQLDNASLAKHMAEMELNGMKKLEGLSAQEGSKNELALSF